MGLTNLCEAGYDEIGFTRTGGLAEYVTVPARLLSPAINMLVGSRNERLEMARHMGATHIISIRQSDPEPLAQSLTGGHGADFVFGGGTICAARGTGDPLPMGHLLAFPWPCSPPDVSRGQKRFL